MNWRTSTLRRVNGDHSALFWGGWGAVSALLMYAFVWSRGQVSPAEDAVILYEYARTWASIGTISYGGADAPIEGATDFLWMALIAGLKVLHVDEFLSSALLNGCAAVFMLWCARGSSGKAVMLLGLFMTPYTVFLVPFMNTAGPAAEKRLRKAARFVQVADGNCRRHDVYAVRNEFKSFAGVESVLLTHGAKRLDDVSQAVQSDRLCAQSLPG